MPTSVRSFSKINLGLAVGPLRADGFHGLTTLYQTLALHDLVTVSAQPAAHTHITLEATQPAAEQRVLRAQGVPSTATGDAERNTAFRIVAGALDRLRMTARVHIHIEKRLPVQGGLGAGSANAAAALLGLERELSMALPGPERLALAAEVGSDVPLFLLGGTVLGLGRGEAVYPFPDSPGLPVVVAIPKVGVSTAQAFHDLDARSTAQAMSSEPASLTESVSSSRVEELSRVLAAVWTSTGVRRDPTGIANLVPDLPLGTGTLPQGSAVGMPSQERTGDLAGNPGSPDNLLTGMMNLLLALVHTGVENDFEEVAFQQHPSLCDIKRALLGQKPGSSDKGPSGALYAALSGSGSALFGIYGSSEAAREAQQRVQSLGIRALVTETLGRLEYWQRMFT